MSEQFDYDLICIGSGPAGQKAAIQAAKIGKRVAIVEKRRIVGGVCLETGTIPSKTFREAVRSFSDQLDFDAGLGFSPKSKPSITQLLGRVNQVIQRETEIQQNQLQRNDVNIILGTARFEGPHELSVTCEEEGTRTITSENILIGVGTRAAKPRGVEPDGKTVIVADGIMELTELPKTVAIVGAGVIGTEYGSMFANLGVEVTVIDKQNRVMGFLDEEITEELTHQLRLKNVTFRMGEAVDRIEVAEAPTRQGIVVLESGKHIVADVVLFSAGRQGATDTLNLESIGIEADERGRLKVNDYYQTDVPHIYAAGDVVGFPALAATSAEQGRIAACHMYGAEVAPMSAHFPFGIYSIPEISMVGETEQSLTEKKIPYETGIARYREIARGQILGDDSGLFKMIFHRDTNQLLGVHAIGTGATELIHVGQAVLGLGGGLDYFIDTVFNYPTLAECYKVAALNAANKLQRSRKAQAMLVQ